MAQLPGNVSQTAADASDSDFEPVPAGRYVLKLGDVKTHNKDGDLLVGGEKSKNPGVPYWNIGFVVDAEYHPAVGERWIWRKFSHSEAAAPFLKQFFTAFGYTPDVDTDDFAEEARCVGIVKLVKKFNGEPGEKDNEFARLIPFDPAKWVKADEAEDEADDPDYEDDDETEDDDEWDTA